MIVINDNTCIYGAAVILISCLRLVCCYRQLEHEG